MRWDVVPAVETERGLRLVQISDLHYAPGAEADSGLLAAERVIRDLAPDLIVVSGDLTREGLFEQLVPVLDFLRGLGIDLVRAIPGNRDYMAGGPGPARPVDSDLDYFLTAPGAPRLDPLVAGNGTPSIPFLDFFDDVDVFERCKEVTFVALDSEPVIPTESFERALAFFEGSSPKATRVFCTHRSLLPVPRKKLKEGDVLVNAGDLLAGLLGARVDLVLCAHLHRVNVWQLSNGEHSLAVVNAPSLLDRSPGKENGLLSIDIGRRAELRVTLHPLDDAPVRQLLQTGAWRKGRKGGA